MFRVRIINTGSSGNLSVVEHKGRFLLLDAGVAFPIIAKAINYELINVSGVLITHSHGDHSKSVKTLIKNGVDVFMHLDTAKELGVEKQPFIHIIEQNKGYQTPDGVFFFGCFVVPHDVTNCAFVVWDGYNEDKLLYVTDTWVVKYRVPELTHIILESNYCVDYVKERYDNHELADVLGARIIRNHHSLKGAVDYLSKIDKSKLREVYIVHLSNDHSDPELFYRKIRETLPESVKLEVWRGKEKKKD